MIDSRAEVDRHAKVGTSVSVGANSYVGPNVVVGDGSIIGRNVVLKGRVHLGTEVNVGDGSVIGGPSRQRALGLLAAEPPVTTLVDIGDGVWLGEFVTVHQPISTSTVIRDGAAVGPHSHIAHDCYVSRRAILAPHVTLGGYVFVGSMANLGLGSAVHPRTAVGGLAMCGMGSVVIEHVRPGAVVVGSPARYLKPNRIGMERAGHELAAILSWISWLSYEEGPIDQRVQVHVDEAARAADRWGRSKKWIATR